MATALDPAKRKTVLEGEDVNPAAVGRFRELYQFDPSAGTHGGIVRQGKPNPGPASSLSEMMKAGTLDPISILEKIKKSPASGTKKLTEREQKNKKRRIEDTARKVQDSVRYQRPVALRGSWQQNAEDLLEIGIMEDQVVDDPLLFGMTKAPSQEALASYFANRMGPFPPPDQQ